MSQKQRSNANKQKIKSEMTRAQAATNKSLTLAQQANRPKPKPLPKVPTPKPKPKPLPRTPEKKESPMDKDNKKCALQYFSALLDPFATPEGACLPYGFPTPTRRDKCIIRGTFACGTTGQGFIGYNPTTVNNVAGVVYTQSNSVGTAASVMSSFTNQASLNASHLPYSSTDVATNTTVSSRFVAGGVRIRYKGNEASRNGTTYANEDFTHHDFTSLTGNQVTAAPNTRPMRPQPEGEWISCLWSGPINANECNLSNNSVYAGLVRPLGIFIDATAGDTYEFEAAYHVEYTGPQVDGMERSHNNSSYVMDGLSIVKGQTEAMPLGSQNPKPLFEEVCEVMETTARKAIRAIPGFLDVIAPTMFALLL